MKTATPTKINPTRHADEYSAVFAWDTPVAALPALEIEGKKYLPLCGTRIDPALAALRTHLPWFSPEAKQPQYVVTYVLATSIAIAAMGRL